MSRAPFLEADSAEALTGHLAEYGDLLALLTERPGLIVISSDPWSGTSALIAAAVDEVDGTRLLVDARGSADGLDLALAIADHAVSRLTPDAAGWWSGGAPPGSAAGLRLSRMLSRQGIDIEGLRSGTGEAARRLREAVELLMAIAEGQAVLAIDHLGLVLSALPSAEAREILETFRAARQEHPRLDLVLAEHPEGPISAAVADPEHPLYQAGQVLRIRRARPARFVDDLAITRPWTDAPVDLIGAAAELAAGVPALIWSTIELAASAEGDHHTRALAGWQRLRRITAHQTARQWDLLRRVHPAAQAVVAALSVGLRPHAVAANPKSINDALTRLRELGVAWQPEPRRWALGNPLLAAWTREHAPPWAARRSR